MKRNERNGRIEKWTNMKHNERNETIEEWTNMKRNERNGRIEEWRVSVSVCKHMWEFYKPLIIQYQLLGHQ